MYSRTSFNFRGAKNVQNWGKKGVFLVILTNLERTWTRMQKRVYQESIFIPEKYVFRVCFQSPFTRMISSGGTRIFCGGIEGEKWDSEGANIQKICRKWLILAIFFFWRGGGGASEGKQNLRLRGGNVPMPPWYRHWWYPAWDTSAPRSQSWYMI